MKSSEHFTSHFRLSHYSVLLLYFLLPPLPASSQFKIFKEERLTLDVTKTFNLYRNWLLSSDLHKQYYLHKLFTTHFVFYLFRTLHQVTYPSYLLLFHLFSFFQQSNDKTQVLLFPKTQVLLFPLKVLCYFYVLDCIVHVSKSFQHPIHSKSTFPSNFLLFFPSAIPNLFQTLHCFIHHKPR